MLTIFSNFFLNLYSYQLYTGCPLNGVGTEVGSIEVKENKKVLKILQFSQ